MHIVSKILCWLITLFHLYVMVLEMFLWESQGPKVFTGFPEELFSQTTVLAANQGLYNGFLAGGLIWALVFIKDRKWQRYVAYYFLGAILVAGIFGAVTASRDIFFLQGLPAIIAILSMIFLNPSK